MNLTLLTPDKIGILTLETVRDIFTTTQPRHVQNATITLKAVTFHRKTASILINLNLICVGYLSVGCYVRLMMLPATFHENLSFFSFSSSHILNVFHNK